MMQDSDGQGDYTVLTDHQGRDIRLTAERWQHILKHPEMDGQQERIAETLSSPERIIVTVKDDSVHAYHRLYSKTPVTRKFLIVVVKIDDEDAFVLTAYFSSREKRGKKIWPV